MKRVAIAMVLVASTVAAHTLAAAESALDALIKNGPLRACTLGGYKPFSFLRSDGACEGIDHANLLAAAKGAKLEVVKTTWANLLPDFTAGKWDIAVGPVGSNERFTKANFKTVSLTIHGENLTISDETVARRAVLFVTGPAEALVQQRLKPGLCAINPEKPLQYDEMAWLLPRGAAAMKGFVDQWPDLAKATGAYQRTADRWLK